MIASVWKRTDLQAHIILQLGAKWCDRDSASKLNSWLESNTSELSIDDYNEYMVLEIGLNVLEKSWKSFGKSLEKMCGNPVKLWIVSSKFQSVRSDEQQSFINQCSDFIFLCWLVCFVLHLGHWSGCVCTSYSSNRGTSESKDVNKFKTWMVSHCMVFSLDFLLPVCKEEVAPEQQERSSSLVQEEPGPPQIKEELEEDVSTVTSLHWDTRCDSLSGKTMLYLKGCVSDWNGLQYPRSMGEK